MLDLFIFTLKMADLYQFSWLYCNYFMADFYDFLAKIKKTNKEI